MARDLLDLADEMGSGLSPRDEALIDYAALEPVPDVPTAKEEAEAPREGLFTRLFRRVRDALGG